MIRKIGMDNEFNVNMVFHRRDTRLMSGFQSNLDSEKPGKRLSCFEPGQHVGRGSPTLVDGSNIICSGPTNGNNCLRGGIFWYVLDALADSHWPE